MWPQYTIGEKKFECQHCKVIFSRSSHRQGHINAVHEKLKPFECDICFTKFIVKSDMSRHIKRIHMKEKHISVQNARQNYSDNQI
jgi:hypothetical protein